MAGPLLSLDPEGRALTITFPTNLQTRLTLDAVGAGELLKVLGSLRQHMKPTVANHFPSGQKVEAMEGGGGSDARKSSSTCPRSALRLAAVRNG
jgi:hypothetical protein